MASNNKIKTNKNCAKMKINFGIIFGILAVVIIATVIIIATSEHFYECVQYDWYEKIDTSEVKTVDNMNDTYDFYRIYLEDDNTFVLKYRLKEGTMLYTANGTYEKNDNKLILKYGSEFPSQELSQICNYTIEKNTIIRDELVDAPDGTRVRIVQKFELK